MGEHPGAGDVRDPAGPGTGAAREADVAGGASRRDLLRAGVGAGAVLATGAWRHLAGSAGRVTLRSALRQPGSLPYPRLAMGTDTIPQIKHIVVLMMENHSYDNHLGMLNRSGADGFTLGPDGKPTAQNPYPNGNIQHTFRMPTTCQLSGRPSQTWTNSHIQFARGKLNGFVKSGSGLVSMGYWQQADLPFYYSLASTYPIADRYFSSLLGQTFPNRRYLMAATSLGMINDTFPNPFDYPANGTIFDKLDQIGVSWFDYYSPLVGFLPTPTVGLFPKLLEHVGNIKRIEHFFDDAKAGTLPGFCIVEPNYASTSEEKPQNIAVGENLAYSVIHAAIHGPEWRSTLLIWTFDEHGGYYDHVVPPRALAPDDIPPDTGGANPYTGFTQYGFRVPCDHLAVGPARLRVAQGLRSLQHLRARRGQVEPPCDDASRRQRQQHAGHAGPDRADFPRTAQARPPAAGHPCDKRARLQHHRARHDPSAGLSHPRLTGLALHLLAAVQR
jgi:phospholipase C